MRSCKINLTKAYSIKHTHQKKKNLDEIVSTMNIYLTKFNLSYSCMVIAPSQYVHFQGFS